MLEERVTGLVARLEDRDALIARHEAREAALTGQVDALRAELALGVLDRAARAVRRLWRE